jgi:hypothetical protein
VPLLLLLTACEESRVPEDALSFEVTTTGIADSCHPEATEGSVETYTYALAFDASSATIYIGEDVFAVGSITGCDLQYQTVIIGSETQNDGFVHWQLFGQASLDAGTNACVEGDDDWKGTETFEIQSSDDDTLEPGCTYDMKTTGRFVPAE